MLTSPLPVINREKRELVAYRWRAGCGSPELESDNRLSGSTEVSRFPSHDCRGAFARSGAAACGG